MAQIESPKESKRVVVDLTMTVQEARQVIWQDLYHNRGPMGELLDKKQIKYGNLCWAVDGAPAQEMRAAARTLLANWLGQPDTLEATRRFGPEVIEGSHYLEENELDGVMQFSVFAGGGAVTAIWAAWTLLQMIVSNPKGPIPLPIAILINVIILALLGSWFYRRLRQEFTKWKSSRQGRKGEEAVVERLRTILDNRWTIFRNLHLPGRKDDVDIALVGPGGVWALEVKAFRGNVRLQNGQWERETKGGWRKLDHNPSHQLKTNAQNVNIYLQRQGLNRWVDGAIVLAEPQPVSHFEASGKFPVWFLPTLDVQMANLTTRMPPSDDEVKRIIALFRELAMKQVTLEDAKDKKS